MLTVKTARKGVDVSAFLSKAISPPSLQAIDTALRALKILGAIDATSLEATALGKHLSLLPLDLKLGKLLVLGILFQCLAPAIDMAACLASKPLFLSPQSPEDREKAKESVHYVLAYNYPQRLTPNGTRAKTEHVCASALVTNTTTRLQISSRYATCPPSNRGARCEHSRNR